MVTLCFGYCFPLRNCLDMMSIGIRIFQKAVMFCGKFEFYELALFSVSLVTHNIGHWLEMPIICNFGWIDRLSFFRQRPEHLPLKSLGKKGVGKSFGFNL